MMKGIILAAGKGTRLYPITIPVCKPLLPVYDKPLIYYSLSTLMLAGIKDILIIVPPGEIDNFSNLLGDGSFWGVRISYKEQIEQKGIADAFIVGSDFIAKESVCLALGDNIFFGPSFRSKVRNASNSFKSGATIFGYYVSDPRPFGVVEFDEMGNAISIEEMPLKPKSNFVVPGLYFYDNRVVEIAKHLKPSDRGELEITTVNNKYIELESLHVITLGEEYSWFDAGTADSLYYAAGEIKSAQRSGKMIGCLEEIALQNHWIDVDTIERNAKKMEKTHYGQYLYDLISELND